MNELLALLEILVRDLWADLWPLTDVHLAVACLAGPLAILLVLAFTSKWERVL